MFIPPQPGTQVEYPAYRGQGAVDGLVLLALLLPFIYVGLQCAHMDLTQRQFADVRVQLFEMEGVGPEGGQVGVLLEKARGCLAKNAHRPYTEY